MSSDLSEKTLVTVARALRAAKLEAIVIGNSASMLNGAPVTTQDIDLLIRDTRPNRRKLARFAEEIGGSAPMPVSELSKVEWIEGRLGANRDSLRSHLWRPDILNPALSSTTGHGRRREARGREPCRRDPLETSRRPAQGPCGAAHPP